MNPWQFILKFSKDTMLIHRGKKTELIFYILSWHIMNDELPRTLDFQSKKTLLSRLLSLLVQIWSRDYLKPPSRWSNFPDIFTQLSLSSEDAICWKIIFTRPYTLAWPSLWVIQQQIIFLCLYDWKPNNYSSMLLVYLKWITIAISSCVSYLLALMDIVKTVLLIP